MTVRELVIGIKYDTDKESVKKSTKTLKDFKNFALSAGTAILTGIAAIGGMALKSAADMEVLSTQFEVMLGSQEKATALMSELQNFAANTPFQLQGIAENAKLLLNFGVAQNKILPTLQMLGDVAGGNQEKFNSLSLVYAQVQSQGKLMGQDLLQMINSGFNPLKVISDKTGKSMSVLKDEMSKGAISADMVTTAFQIATSEGGMFFQSMMKGSQTLTGAFSTFKDNLTMILVDIGKTLLEPVKNFLIEATKAIQTDLVPAIKQILPPLTAVLTQLSTMALKILPVAVSLLTPFVKILLAIVTPLTNLISVLLPSLLKIVDAISPVLQTIGNIIGDIITAFTPFIDEVISQFADMIKDIMEIFNEILLVLQPIIRIFINLFIPVLRSQLMPIILQLKVVIEILLLLFRLFMPLLQPVLFVFEKISQMLLNISNIITQNLFKAFDSFFTLVEDKFNIFIGFIIEKINWLITKLNKIPKINIPLIQTSTEKAQAEAERQRREHMLKEKQRAEQMLQINQNLGGITVNGATDPLKTGEAVKNAIGTAFQIEVQKILINQRI